MILIDWTNIAITSIMASFYNKPIEEDIARRNILASLGEIISKFSKKYGTDEIIICTDTGSSWRKTIFKNYKSHRKLDREKEKERWNDIYTCLNKITDEIRDNFPYKVLHINHMEADDIVATMVFKYSHFHDIIIISNDKDFIQLQGKTVKQWSPLKNSYIKELNPDKYLYEHIIKGDRSDSIPNILSSEDCFINGIRQTSVRQKKLDEWVKHTPEANFNTEELERFNANKILIDLTMIPNEYQQNILKEYDSIENKEKRSYDILKYFVEHNILVERINNFV